MPGRIYPNTKKESFEELSQIETLDLDMVGSLLGGITADEEKHTVEAAKDDVPEAFKKQWNKGKDKDEDDDDDSMEDTDMDDSDDDDDDDDEKEDKKSKKDKKKDDECKDEKKARRQAAQSKFASRKAKRAKQAAPKKRVKIASAEEVAFGSGSVRMPSAAYIEAAKKAGAHEEVEKALKIRQAIRSSMLNKFAETEKMQKQAAAKKAKAVVKKEAKADHVELENDYSEEAKAKIASRLRSLGVPESIVGPYVKYAYNAKTASDVPGFVTKISQMDVDESTKNDLMAEMMKTAKLEQEDKDRIVKFWRDELGYQDAEWINDLVDDVDPATGR